MPFYAKIESNFFTSSLPSLSTSQLELSLLIFFSLSILFQTFFFFHLFWAYLIFLTFSAVNRIFNTLFFTFSLFQIFTLLLFFPIFSLRKSEKKTPIENFYFFFTLTFYFIVTSFKYSLSKNWPNSKPPFFNSL